MNNKIKEVIPFFLALVMCMAHFLQVISTPDKINEDGSLTSFSIIPAVLYTFCGLVIISIFIILKKKVWKYLFLCLIILTFTPFLKFSNWTFSIGIGYVSIELISCALFIIHLILNPDILNFIKLKFEPSEKKLAEKEREKEINFEKSVQAFEKKFEVKTPNELKIICNDTNRVHEAREAASRLLNKK